MRYSYKTKNVCATRIDFDLTDGIVSDISFYGGCNGNLKAISALIKGKTVEEIAPILEGNTCGFKKTSCADQLVKGLKEAMAAQQ